MKNLIIILIVLTGITSYAQKIEQNDVPANVQAKIKSLYPDIKDVKWVKEKNNYLADFEVNDIKLLTTGNGKITINSNAKVVTTPALNKMHVLFDEKGNLIYTETELKLNQIPPDASNYINVNYPSAKIDFIKKVVKGNITTYAVKVDTKTLIFDDKGKFIRKEK